MAVSRHRYSFQERAEAFESRDRPRNGALSGVWPEERWGSIQLRYTETRSYNLSLSVSASTNERTKRSLTLLSPAVWRVDPEPRAYAPSIWVLTTADITALRRSKQRSRALL